MLENGLPRFSVPTFYSADDPNGQNCLLNILKRQRLLKEYFLYLKKENKAFGAEVEHIYILMIVSNLLN